MDQKGEDLIARLPIAVMDRPYQGRRLHEIGSCPGYQDPFSAFRNHAKRWGMSLNIKTTLSYRRSGR
jgi:hypothetical protein